MIVEFVGPPASGKTTLAVALAERLRRGGFEVQRWLSSRPGEESLARTGDGSPVSRSPLGATARRLLRPAYELILAATQSRVDRPNGDCPDILARGLARGQILRFFRMKQYLVRLDRIWTEATMKREICIFDQGYIQVIATIMLHQPHLGDADLMALLDVAPKSDLVIFVDTPVDEIERRLGRRQRMLSRLERLFEEDLGDVGRQAQAAAHLRALLSQSGRQVLSIGSDAPLDDCVGGVRRAMNSPSVACGASIG